MPGRTSCRRRCTPSRIAPTARSRCGPEAHGADLPRVRRARPAARAAAGEALHDRVDVPLRRAGQGSLSRALAGVRRGDRQRRPVGRRRADPALRHAPRPTRRDAVPPRAQLDRLPRVSPGIPRGSARVARREPRPARRGDAREGRDEPAARLRQLRGQARGRSRGARRGAEDRRVAVRRVRRSASTSCAATSTPPVFAIALEPTLVRGLDYYSRTTWEFVGPLENENATLSGGGRYDYLVEEIGGPPTPGVGFGAGIERLLLALEAEGVATRGDALDRRVLRVRARRAARRRSRAGSPSCAGAASRATRTTRDDRSRAADAGRQERSVDGRGGRRGERDDPPAGKRRRGDPPRRTSRQTVAMSWRDVMCGDPRPDHVGRDADARRLGGHASRPRRSRLRRPSRSHGRDAARDQPRALAGRSRAGEGDPQRVRAARARRGRRALGGDDQRGDGDGRRRGAGRRARDRLALDAAPVPARRGGRRRDAAPALPLARPAHGAHAAQHAALPHGDLVDPRGRWTAAASSTSGRRA